MRRLRLFGHEYAGWGHMGLLWYILAAEEIGLLGLCNERYSFLGEKDFSSPQLRYLLSPSINFLDVPNELAVLSSTKNRRISQRFTPINFQRTEEFKACSRALGIDPNPYLELDLSGYHLVSSLWYRLNSGSQMIRLERNVEIEVQRWSFQIFESLKLPQDRPICFLHIRDSPGQHIRNCNPENYSLTVDYLISKGYTVYRSGIGRQLRPRRHLVQNKDHWATSYDVPALLSASLTITCQSGPSYIAGLMQKPNLVVNLASPIIGLMIHDHPKTAVSIRNERNKEQTSDEILTALIEFEKWATCGFPRNSSMSEISSILRDAFNLNHGIEYVNIVGTDNQQLDLLDNTPLLQRHLQSQVTH